MANVSVTAADVRGPAEQRYVKQDTAGEAATAGTWLYRKDSDQKLWLADADTSEDTATVVGFALTNADADGPITYAIGGDVDVGGTLVKGRSYILSDDSGGLMSPESDIGSGDYHTFLGVASSTTNLTINIYNSGITV